MSRFLLDSSFVIDLLNEIASSQRGPARAWAARNPGAELWIPPVTSAEVREAYRAFRWQPSGINLPNVRRFAKAAPRSVWAKMTLGRLRLPYAWTR